MAALSAQQIDDGTIDRLVSQRHSLEKHMQDLENQLVETARHHAAVSETLFRLRKKQNKTNKIAVKTEFYY